MGLNGEWHHHASANVMVLAPNNTGNAVAGFCLRHSVGDVGETCPGKCTKEKVVIRPRLVLKAWLVLHPLHRGVRYFMENKGVFIVRNGTKTEGGRFGRWDGKARPQVPVFNHLHRSFIFPFAPAYAPPEWCHLHRSSADKVYYRRREPEGRGPADAIQEYSNVHLCRNAEVGAGHAVEVGEVGLAVGVERDLFHLLSIQAPSGYGSPSF